MPRQNETIFSVVFKKGLADKNRLPLNHVIATLRELDSMIREVGRRVQREAGREISDGDFGVELLAGSGGIAFQKGSVKSQAAITRDVTNGTKTLSRIIQTTDIIEKKRILSMDEYRAPIIRGLANISNIQQKDKTELRIQLAERGKVVERARFSDRGVRAIKNMEDAEFSIEDLTLYGKLRVLSDRSLGEAEDDIWGLLIEDNGNRWRIKFAPTDLAIAQRLFTKQVIAFGDAKYFKTRFPRLDVKSIKEDIERDYTAGADRFSKEYENIFGDQDPDQILKDIRG